MAEELFIDGMAVDLKPESATTLNFKSNLLGDISKITASNSQTIRCPKTTRNRRVFDNPGAIAYLSGKRYSRHSATLIRDGVEVVRAGYAVLLSAADAYEIAIYWGVMSNFQAWVDKAAKLSDLPGDEALPWNKDVEMSTVQEMESTGYGYARYDCGVTNTDLVNIHPSATAWWILDKIAKEAGFTIEMPGGYVEALKRIAVPCLSQRASDASNEAEATVTTYPFLLHDDGFWGFTINKPYGEDKHGVFDQDDNTKILKVDGATSVTIDIKDASGKMLGMTVYADSIAAFPVRVYIFATLYSDRDERTELVGISNGSAQASASTGASVYQKTYFFAPIHQTFEWGRSDYLRMFPSNGTSAIIGSRLGNTRFTVFEDFEHIIYPSIYPIPQNLPEITQIDFVKAICGMLGIFVAPDPSDNSKLKFVSLDVLEANKAQARDWSRKLVRGNDDEPKGVEYKFGDYARRNLFRYKEDDAVAIKADGVLTVDSELLDTEKTIITLPFAPSEGSTIRHYELTEAKDGDEVAAEAKTVNVKDRIMSLVADETGRARLTFDGLDFPTLLSKYYVPLSQLLNRAITITEQIRLNEYDLKSLDFTVPFYLRQYGKFFGVVSVQSSTGKPCEVKAVQLPSNTHDEGGDPTKINCYIGYRAAESLVFTATRPPHSDVSIRYTVYTTTGEQVERNAVFPRGAEEYTAPDPLTRDFERVDILELTPSGDSIYNYLIAK